MTVKSSKRHCRYDQIWCEGGHRPWGQPTIANASDRDGALLINKIIENSRYEIADLIPDGVGLDFCQDEIKQERCRNALAACNQQAPLIFGYFAKKLISIVQRFGFKVHLCGYLAITAA